MIAADGDRRPLAHPLDRLAGRCAIAHQIAEYEQPVTRLVERMERVNAGVNVGENQVSHKLFLRRGGRRSDLQVATRDRDYAPDAPAHQVSRAYCIPAYWRSLSLFLSDAP